MQDAPIKDRTPDSEEKIKNAVRRACAGMADDLRGHRVVLFGSRASGSARERSDFDIGVMGDRPLPLKTFYRLPQCKPHFRDLTPNMMGKR